MTPEKKLVINAKQFDFHRKLLSICPMLHPKTSLFVREKCPFALFNDENTKVGEIMYQGKYLFEMEYNKEKYHIQLHKGNLVTLKKEKNLVAEIKKDYVHSFYKSKYEILASDIDNFDVVLLVAIFSDLVLFDFGTFFFVIGPKTVLRD